MTDITPCAQDTISLLREEVHYERGVSKLAMKHRDEAEATISRLTADNEAMRRALEPFATVSKFVKANHYPDNHEFVVRVGEFLFFAFTMGDLRRATAALADADGSDEK